MSDVLCDHFISTKKYMGRILRISTLSILLLLIVSCRTSQVKTRQTDQSSFIQNYISRNLQGYQTDQIKIDYIATCKARIKTASNAYSGSCKIIVTHLQQLQLTVFHPLGGMIMKIYADDNIIQLLNRSEKRFYQIENNRKNRRKIPLLTSLRIIELQSVLWGRKTDLVKNNLIFLIKNQRPYQVIKKKQNHNLVIHYKRWLQSLNSWFPKTIEMEDLLQNISIKLVITEFSPGLAEKLKILSIPEGYSGSP